MGRRDGAEVPESDGEFTTSDLIGADVSRDNSAEETASFAGAGGSHPEANLLGDEAAARFLWDARNTESARARTREHWIRQQAREAATFEGILRALSERGAPVTAWTVDGGTATGSVRAVSRELVLIGAEGVGDTWVVRHGLAGVRTESGSFESGSFDGAEFDGAEFDAGVASDDRGPNSATTLTGLLAALAEERAALTARCGGIETAGRMAGAGTNVVTLRLAGGGLSYLPTARVTLLRLS